MGPISRFGRDKLEGRFFFKIWDHDKRGSDDYIGSTMPGTLRAGIDNDRTIVNHIFNKELGADRRGTMQLNNIRKALLEQ